MKTTKSQIWFTYYGIIYFRKNDSVRFGSVILEKKIAKKNRVSDFSRHYYTSGQLTELCLKSPACIVQCPIRRGVMPKFSWVKKRLSFSEKNVEKMTIFFLPKKIWA